MLGRSQDTSCGAPSSSFRVAPSPRDLLYTIRKGRNKAQIFANMLFADPSDGDHPAHDLARDGALRSKRP